MDTKQVFIQGVEQIMNYVCRFLSLSFGKTSTTMKLQTFKRFSSEFCMLNISTNGHQANINLMVDSSWKNILYNEVFWKLFDSYANNNEIVAENKIRIDLKRESHWEIELNHIYNKNKVVFEFVLEEPLDLVWVSHSFEQWNNELRVKTKKIEKK